MNDLSHEEFIKQWKEYFSRIEDTVSIYYPHGLDPTVALQTYMINIVRILVEYDCDEEHLQQLNDKIKLNFEFFKNKKEEYDRPNTSK